MHSAASSRLVSVSYFSFLPLSLFFIRLLVLVKPQWLVGLAHYRTGGNRLWLIKMIGCNIDVFWKTSSASGGGINLDPDMITTEEIVGVDAR